MRKAIEKIVTNRILSYLRNTDPQAMIAKSEKDALAAFQRAAKEIPAYKKHLQENGTNPKEVRDIASFKRLVPFLDKDKTFIAYREDIKQLCLDGDLKPLGEILTSSGHSGNFSFGLSTRKDIKGAAQFVDFGLDLNFNVSKKRTLLINCLPMGVKVPSKATVVADISVRSDMALGIVRGFGKDFDQIIMVGENSYIKKILEEGIAQGIEWSRLDVRIIVGEEGFSEYYRSYMLQLLGVDPEKEKDVVVGSSMGISELGLSIFQETKDTIRIRRQAHQNAKLKYDLFGEGIDICPMLFNYFPTRTYVEENRSPSDDHIRDYELVITNLSRDSMLPLIRYNTKDRGKIIPYPVLQTVLEKHNLQGLLPEFKLPLLSLSGRGKAVTISPGTVYPEEIKEAIYSDFALPGTTNGNFKLSDAGSKVLVEIQLHEGVAADESLTQKFLQQITQYVTVPVEVRLYRLEEYPYPLDYERKYRYVD